MMDDLLNQTWLNNALFQETLRKDAEWKTFLPDNKAEKGSGRFSVILANFATDN